MYSCIAVLVGLLAGCVHGLTNQPLKDSYDYIVVGGGTAGSVVASRLSEDPSASVLVLESGMDDSYNNAIQIPRAFVTNMDPKSGVAKAFKPEPMNNACKGLINKQPVWLLGNVLGGTSSINGMIYLRGSMHDFDAWKAMGLDGWGYEDVLPYFKKSERNTNEEYLKSGYHGSTGPWTLSDKIVAPKLVEAFLKAGQQLGYPTTDLNGATAEGFMNTQRNVYRGKRVSTYRAFLHPIRGRRNLQINTMTLVTKILINNNMATGVQVLDMNEEKNYIISANREVILSAGALLSPQLLMLSGIGPRDHLIQMGIPVVKDLPVGNNLADHVWTHISFVFNQSVSLSDEQIMTFKEMASYAFYGNGSWSTNLNQGNALIRLKPKGEPVVVLDCTFDMDMCGFQQSIQDNFDWTRQSGFTSSSDTGPGNDHTRGDASGYYIYIEASGIDPNYFATVQSPTFQSPSNGPVCVTFYYHMYGMHVKALMVYEVDGNTVKTEIWRKVKSDLPENNMIFGLNQWIKAEATASSSSRSIQLTAIRGGADRSQPFGDIAVDDIRILDGSCGSPVSPQPDNTDAPQTEPVKLLDCNFDFGIEVCEWSQETGSDDFDWSRKSGRTLTDMTGPSNDHTKGDASGYYVYIEASGVDPNTEAVLKTPVIPYNSAGKCLSFYYHMFGRHIGLLKVELVRGTVGTKIWERKNTDLEISGDMVYGRDQWIRARVYVSAEQAFFRFTGVRGGESRGQPFGDIAIDDVTVFTGSCDQSQDEKPVDNGETPLLRCDFESGTCGMTQNGNLASDQFDWTWNSGSTSTSETGPSADHTFRDASGHYLYIEASGVAPTLTATISTAILTPIRPICVSFYYHMYGKSIGTLSVIEVDMNGQKSEIWTMTLAKLIENNLQNDDWLRGGVTASAQTRYIQFTATRGGQTQGEPFGDIAIDDILIMPTACVSSSQAYDPIPTTNNNAILIHCDFDSDLCGFHQDKYIDDFDWHRITGPTLSAFTGPDQDHTQGNANGYYMYIEANGRSNYNKAILTSPSFSQYNCKDVCLTFYYHMYGKDVGSLSVFETKKTNEHILIWTKSRFQSTSDSYGINGWVKAEVSATSETVAFIFQGIVFDGTEGDIAIDDVTVRNGTCQPSQPALDNIGNIPLLPTGSSSPLIQLELLDTLFGHSSMAMMDSSSTNFIPEYFQALHAHEVGQPGMSLVVALLHPRSRGTARLRSNNIIDPPRFILQYLSDDQDVKDLIKGIRFVQDLAKTPAFQAIGARYVTPHHPGCLAILNMDTDEYWECYIRHNTLSQYHFTSTCQMGVGEDAVVDGRLRVHGINKLRVVDASVIPTTISANTMTTTVMIAEKAADMIKMDNDYVTVTNAKRKVNETEEIKDKHHNKTKVEDEKENDAVTENISDLAEEDAHFFIPPSFKRNLNRNSEGQNTHGRRQNSWIKKFMESRNIRSKAKLNDQVNIKRNIIKEELYNLEKRVGKKANLNVNAITD